MGMVDIYTDRFTVAFANLRNAKVAGSALPGTLVLGDGAQWQSEALHMYSMKTTLLKWYQKNSWQETSHPIAMHLASHCELRISNNCTVTCDWVMHLVLFSVSASTIVLSINLFAQMAYPVMMVLQAKASKGP